MKCVPELPYDVEPKVMTFALKFLNSAPKEKLIAELDLADAVANKIIDQRDFGGYKNLDDIFEKKLLRKKKFNTFRDRLLTFAKENKPSDKPADDDNNAPKKGKKKGSAAAAAQAEALLLLQKAERPVFKESEPLRLRFGYLLAQPKPVIDVVAVELAQPVSVA
ncbi:hypothetical protein H257_07524 [Aphanomyces astaci]|uniref:Uncharacterized protein n=2 Tax=Aphanomyces astaci TaxID=112090 RepID=W4GI08_APHAT|nr:hypothetical protein H257_07524 [Aphanomyces astaci]ETV78664.1 hypothetical protein H257_07524 [Aphanomyces astaci]RQM19659.1 hypothetical protein B5M09_011322 [Aphanomyces astaci]|eukprot:XP_009831383.1 hypothetical protein H257_07524 [Aphanomyces astaci]